MKKIAFIGAGAMAEAIISGMIQYNFVKSKQICVTNKSNRERLKYLKDKYNVYVEENREKVIDRADIIVLSVKPNDIKSAIDSIKKFVYSEQLIISVIAGVSTTAIETQMNKEIPIVRAMPNTSASVGFSATALAKGKYATEKHIEMSILLFDTIGITTVVRENDMDIVTGISGSGPAYIYYFVEAMEKAAIENGLDQQTAKTLITQTIIGAGKMLKQSGKSAKSLRENVTSPGGTTEVGIKTLAKFNFQESIIECIKSAIDKAAEIGNKS